MVRLHSYNGRANLAALRSMRFGRSADKHSCYRPLRAWSALDILRHGWGAEKALSPCSTLLSHPSPLPHHSSHLTSPIAFLSLPSPPPSPPSSPTDLASPATLLCRFTAGHRGRRSTIHWWPTPIHARRNLIRHCRPQPGSMLTLCRFRMQMERRKALPNSLCVDLERLGKG